MFLEHAYFELPEDQDTVIWRYMDFTKFVSILETSTLFFPTPDQLNDPYEGYWSVPTLNEFLAGDSEYTDVPMSRDVIKSQVEHSRTEIGVSCWHINEHESAAMWKLYLMSYEGIAIRSTVGHFVDVLEQSTQHNVYAGKVKYIDYETEQIHQPLSFNTFMTKRTCFEHERELRAIALQMKTDENGRRSWTDEPIKNQGISIPIDVKALIECVYVAPHSPRWFQSLVEKLLLRYGVNDVPVNRSELYDAPM